MSLIPSLPPEATDAERLRYVRHWAILGLVTAVPVWALAFLLVHTDGVLIAFAAVTAVSVLNIASLTWRIGRAERR